jgi:hypothetical protein
MKLICEVNENVNYLTEEKDDGAKNYFIEGIFMQGDVKNRNGRVYPSEVLARESKRYGMGSLKEKGGAAEVQKDFYLATAADIVADPSAPEAFVSGIMEGKEWIWDNGIIRESDISNYEEAITTVSKEDLETAKLKIFENFLSKL